MANISHVGTGTVILIAGGGKLYTDLAAKFCRTERDLESIVGSPENKSLLKLIATSPHQAMMEFDDFIFGVEGFSRVTEIQLVRKRHASYAIKSGRVDKNGKRSFDLVLPKSILAVSVEDPVSEQTFSTTDLVELLELWYEAGVKQGIAEEDLRYLKPQGTEFKGLIKMNASALKDWFQIRLCNRAQSEIRNMAQQMFRLVREVAPDLFQDCGPSCKVLGYCPEHEQCAQLKGIIPTKEDMTHLIQTFYSIPPSN